MRLARPLLHGSLLLLLTVGCSVFDEQLYLDAEADDSDGGEGTASDGGPVAATEGVAALSVTDACVGADVPVFTESAELELDFDSLTSVGLGYAKCSSEQIPDPSYPGPDGFFILRASKDERWNIKVVPQEPQQDVAIVVLEDGCSPESCKSIRDRCGETWGEDFALVAKSDVDYTISVESLTPGVGGKVSLILDKSLCGDGVQDPGESCDGEADCDEQCRRVVESGVAPEGEPNDIFTGVDMLGVAEVGGQVTITGSVGGPCDEDHYAFIVPEGASASVAMYAPGGLPCPEDTPPIVLPLVDFLDEGGPRKIGAGKVGGPTGGCPSFNNTGADPDFAFARNLPASEYHLIVNAFTTEQPIPYELVVDIQPDTPE